MPILRLLSLPVRAPLLTVLFLVALVLGNHWQIVQPTFTSLYGVSSVWFWCLVLLQAQVVVVFCTMPDLLLRQVSLLMASSRVKRRRSAAGGDHRWHLPAEAGVLTDALIRFSLLLARSISSARLADREELLVECAFGSVASSLARFCLTPRQLLHIRVDAPLSSPAGCRYFLGVEACFR